MRGAGEAPAAGAGASRTSARRRYAEFLDLAEPYDHVRLDTTMVFTDFFAEPVPARAAAPAAPTCGHKVLLGTDFPTIPYPYAHQLEGLARLDLGDDWLRAVCWENGAALFGRACIFGGQLRRMADRGRCDLPSSWRRRGAAACFSVDDANQRMTAARA